MSHDHDHGGMDMSTEMNMGTTMDMHGGGSHHMMMMMMYFHTGNSETVLFKEWKVTDTTSLVWSFIIIALMGFLYEGLKFAREVLYERATRGQRAGNGGSSTSTAELARGKSHRKGLVDRWCSQVFNAHHLLQTLLHVIQFFLAYLLMLIFMTYNVWLCLAVLVGAGAGFFLFGWKKQSAVDSTEHCT